MSDAGVLRMLHNQSKRRAQRAHERVAALSTGAKVALAATAFVGGAALVGSVTGATTTGPGGASAPATPQIEPGAALAGNFAGATGGPQIESGAAVGPFRAVAWVGAPMQVPCALAAEFNFADHMIAYKDTSAEVHTAIIGDVALVVATVPPYQAPGVDDQDSYDFHSKHAQHLAVDLVTKKLAELDLASCMHTIVVLRDSQHARGTYTSWYGPPAGREIDISPVELGPHGRRHDVRPVPAIGIVDRVRRLCFH
jgi:hypothetical protein